MIAHSSPISGVAATAGTFVATAGYDNQVILWNARSGEPLERCFHDHLANHVAFSDDGKRLVSSGSDYTARVWSVPDMKLLAVLADHDDDVEMAAFHPTARMIATACRDHKVRVFDEDGQLLTTMSGHGADVISVAWSADGETVLSSSDDGTIKHWLRADGTLLRTIDLGDIETDTIAVGRNGTVFAGNDQGELIIVGQGVPKRREAHAAGVKRIVLEPTQNLLVSLSYDRTMRIWTMDDDWLSAVATAALPPIVWARSCAFLDRDTILFATFGSSYATYHIGSDRWNLDAVAPTHGVNAVAVHQGRRFTIGDAGILRIDGVPKGRTESLCNFLVTVRDRVLTGGQTGAVMDAYSGAILYQHKAPLNCAAVFTRNAEPHVVVGTYTGDGLVFRVTEDGTLDLVQVLRLHTNAVKSTAIANGTLFSVCADSSAAWFDLSNLEEIRRIDVAHDRIANACVALPDGRFASVSRDRKLRLWRDGNCDAIETPHLHSIKCIAAAPDGTKLALGSYVGLVALYDLACGTWTCTRPTAAGISAICFDRDKQCFAAASYDGRVFDIGAETP